MGEGEGQGEGVGEGEGEGVGERVDFKLKLLTLFTVSSIFCLISDFDDQRFLICMV